MGVPATVSTEDDSESAEALAGARAGDFDAFEALYRMNLQRIYALCLRMTADRGRAEELTQETFIRAWHKLGQFRGEGDFGGWLRRVALNLVLSERRSAGRRQRHEVRSENVVDFPAPRAADRASAMDLEDAISRLPTGARRVFVLHDVEGYRHEEIARLLGVATGTSKAQLHRARRLLREALNR
jgi:RNA polymerase sigma-70 factor (ECF subfamily)